MSKKKGIIILPDTFSYFKLLSQKFDYFSLNPEMNDINGIEYIPTDIFSNGYLLKLMDYQKTLNNTFLPAHLLPNTVKYDLNFKFSERLFTQIIKNKLTKRTGRDVYAINDFNHNSFFLVFLNFISKFNLNTKFINFFLLPYALIKLLISLFEKDLSIVFANRKMYDVIKINLNVSNKFYFISNNPNNRSGYPLKIIVQLLQFFHLPITFSIFLYTFLKYRKNLNKLEINPTIILRNISIYVSSYLLRRILYFKFISISNYGLSEALLLTSPRGKDFVINHGVHYFDKNQLINHFWKFHSQTMFGKVPLMSNNIFDFIFLKKNQINSNYVFKQNTIRKPRLKIVSKPQKRILIADTFKSQNSIRPLIYNTAFEYVDFINQICDVVPKNFEIVLRHRKNTILTKKYISKINKRIVFSDNDDIYNDFLFDPIVISYSSTVLFEAIELGLRVISFDPYNRGMNFLNLYDFCRTKIVSKRFQIKVNNKEDLQNLLCRV